MIVELTTQAATDGGVTPDAVRIVKLNGNAQMERIIDDGDIRYTDTSKEGSPGWKTGDTTEKLKCAYGGDYRVNHEGAMTARWTFQKLPAGKYHVYATWPAAHTGASRARYLLYDDGQQIGRAELDQRREPGDVEAAGYPWESLGEYEVQSGTLTVELDTSISSGGAASADAIGIVKVE